MMLFGKPSFTGEKKLKSIYKKSHRGKRGKLKESKGLF
jgi:hypothetical protein